MYTTDTQYGQSNNNVQSAQSLSGFVYNFKRNFLELSTEIVPGLVHNQYEIIKRVYFYSHNQFESGPLDDNNNPKYFYDLMTDRNDQATKNIDIDTKNCYIEATNAGTYLLSWLLRQEFMGYAKTSGFGMKLNSISDTLPDFGTVVWKKIKNSEGRTDVREVELITLMNDPGVECLKDGIVIERHLLTQSELLDKGSYINQDEVKKLIKSGKTSAPVPYMQLNGSYSAAANLYVDKTTPYYEVFELWGEIPYWLYKKYQTPNGQADDQIQGQGAVADDDYNKSVYVMALVAGVENSGYGTQSDGSTECVLKCKEVNRNLFPYKEVHYRRRKGRWLGVGNYELCFDQIEKANEVTNRFFASLRIALLHLYQTRDKNHVANIMNDMLDGDVVVTKSELGAIPTEIRGLAEYKQEIENIENKCNHLCNTFEVVTGENLPSGTPFQLGAQMLTSATKLFEYVRQNEGLFIEAVFNEWLLPDFGKQLTDEHILDLTSDVDDLKIYYDSIRKVAQYEMIKRYILDTGGYPTSEQLDLVGSLVKDQSAHLPKQVMVEQATYPATIKYGLKVVTTGENESSAESKTLETTLETVAANPQALQDPRFMKILGMILERKGFSPLQINAINETPTNPTLNPANQGGANPAQRSNISSPTPGGGAPPTPVPSAVA